MRLHHCAPGFAVLAALVISFLVSGCSTYSNVGSQFEDRRTRLVIPLPQGWLRYEDAGDAYVLTSDGLRLERIAIRITEVGDEIEGTERVYQAGMLPNEIAELSLGLMEAMDATKNFELNKIETIEIAEQDGFLAEAEFSEGGLPKRAIVCGALIGESVCEMSYVAARDVYFEKHLPIFEQMLKSAHMESK